MEIRFRFTFSCSISEKSVRFFRGAYTVCFKVQISHTISSFFVRFFGNFVDRFQGEILIDEKSFGFLVFLGRPIENELNRFVSCLKASSFASILNQ